MDNYHQQNTKGSILYQSLKLVTPPTTEDEDKKPKQGEDFKSSFFKFLGIDRNKLPSKESKEKANKKTSAEVDAKVSNSSFLEFLNINNKTSVVPLKKDIKVPVKNISEGCPRTYKDMAASHL